MDLDRSYASWSGNAVTVVANRLTPCRVDTLVWVCVLAALFLVEALPVAFASSIEPETRAAAIATAATAAALPLFIGFANWALIVDAESGSVVKIYRLLDLPVWRTTSAVGNGGVRIQSAYVRRIPFVFRFCDEPDHWEFRVVAGNARTARFISRDHGAATAFGRRLASLLGRGFADHSKSRSRSR